MATPMVCAMGGEGLDDNAQVHGFLIKFHTGAEEDYAAL